MARSLLRERRVAMLAGFFGLQALLLGAVGIYGVMAFQVARRRREIGIRMALGANAGSVIALTLGQTARLTLLGCAIGAAAGLMLTRIRGRKCFMACAPTTQRLSRAQWRYYSPSVRRCLLTRT